MKKIQIPEFHKELLSQNELLKAAAEKLAKQDPSFSIRKPGTEMWSVMECFEHMNIIYRIYIQNIKEAIKNSKVLSSRKDYFKPTFAGYYFYLSMAPNKNLKPRYRIKTFKRFKPSGNKTDHIETFLSHHEQFTELINQIPDLDLDRIRVNSSLGKIMRFKLGDIYRIVTGHNQRHMIQAENAYKTVSAGTFSK